MAFINHNQTRSAVNSAPIAATQPRRIANRVYRQCAKDGFNARIKAELSSEPVPAQPGLYSHHQTRQSYYNKGWFAVTPMHILHARARHNQPPHQKGESHGLV
ncbi:hypothetical protein LZP69_10550 [Shewanella sp. AS1]|uniref:hypothetical protein n=1 Tax=Shewanella sp. AS1 TaxID=2907626 RepID=UPI001F2B217E|nr:hypothetical protein [Shewanella sp. AS1]MCE9679599.1 hypothetical protein [Shewanella sp. AS1]